MGKYYISATNCNIKNPICCPRPLLVVLTHFYGMVLFGLPAQTEPFHRNGSAYGGGCFDPGIALFGLEAQTEQFHSNESKPPP